MATGIIPIPNNLLSSPPVGKKYPFQSWFPSLTETYCVIYILLRQDACSGKACIDMEPATCTVVGAVCECNDGYYPEVTFNGICTRKSNLMCIS